MPVTIARLLWLLFIISTVQAATQVNISIAQQQHDGEVANVQELNVAPAKLRTAEESMRGSHYLRQQQQRFNTQQLGQLRKAQAQHKQNQEFERYIQSYHSGPTVETVFETSSPSPSARQQIQSHHQQAHTSALTSTSDDAAPQRLVTIGSRSHSSNSGRQMHTFERQVALPATTERKTYAMNSQVQIKPVVENSSSNSASSSASVDVPDSPRMGLSGGYDTSSYDLSDSYSKPAYDQSSFSYESQADLQNEYPPSVDESQGGYFEHSDATLPEQSHVHNTNAYLPPPEHTYNRPTVTKTIQIAQPALKAKKYEVRHPAIQKEFYDIEERVLIKPAGTIVVELEHPVAKIPKGEAILPLGIPHPAVAGAYSNNGISVAQSQSSSVGGKSATTTAGSIVTTTPGYDQSAHNDYVEDKLRQSSKRTEDFYAANTRDEVDQAPRRVEIRNNGESSSFNYNTAANYHDAQSKPQKDDYFDAEFVENSDRTQEFKPARLMEQPAEKPAHTVTTHVIKHEHNIHLPPSQHNIYLGRLQQKPLKPFQGSSPAHKGPLVVYAANRVRPSAAQRVQYSAPYSQMRMEPHSANLEEEKSVETSPHTHIQIQIPQNAEESHKPIVVSSTIAPMTQTAKTGSYRLAHTNSEVETFSPVSNYKSREESHFGELQQKPDCDQKNVEEESKFSRLVEQTADSNTATASAAATSGAIATDNVDINVKSANGHVSAAGSRVIAATPAPTDASAASESFHTRRIVVNHPFQTVREVVEHEPYTNYHHVQVNQPALAPYYQMHGSLRQLDEGHIPAIVYPAHMTHGRLQYAYHH